MRRITIAHTVAALKGQGEEYLLDADGNLIARFYDGQMGAVVPEVKITLTKEQAEAETLVSEVA